MMRWRSSAASRAFARAALRAIARSRPAARSRRPDLAAGQVDFGLRSCGSDALCRAVFVSRGNPVAWLRCRAGLPGLRSQAVAGIFLAIDRRHVRGILAKIRPADAKFRTVCIDPLPERFS